MPLGIDFYWILVGFGRQVGRENRAKIDQKSIQKGIEPLLTLDDFAVPGLFDLFLLFNKKLWKISHQLPQGVLYSWRTLHGTETMLAVDEVTYDPEHNHS